MTKPNDQAFPDDVHGGMTKREYYVIQILQGIHASGKYESVISEQQAVASADELIRQLNKEK